MTISSTTVETTTALGNGVTTDFVIGFTFQDNDHIQVTLIDQSMTPYTRTVLVYGAAADKYTIKANDPLLGWIETDPGTHVSMGTAPTANQRLTIRRIAPATQTVDYSAAIAFPADDHEEQMDKATMVIQQISEQISRCIQYPSYPVPTDDQLNAQTYIDALDADVAAAEAAQVAAAASQVAAAASEVAAAASAAAAAVSAASLVRYKANVAFDGSETFKSVDVSGSITDSRDANWQLSDNANDYEILAVKITKPTAGTVRIDSDPPLAAGSYRLTGVQC